MAAIKTPFVLDSAAELRDVIGNDATATIENGPKFIDSDSPDFAAGENIMAARDTDDTEDSEEEEDELEDEEFEEDDEDDDEDEDEEDEEDEDGDDFGGEEEEEDEEDEVGAIALLATGSTNLRGPVVNGKTFVKKTLEEDDDAGDEGEAVDSYREEGADDTVDDGDSRETDRAIDAALRMKALVAVTSEYAVRRLNSEVA